ncbi:MAG: hypothetical protein AB2L07_12625 [Thermoanaerobaculaceae bacterium]
MPVVLLPVALTLCLAHPVELDREVGRRAMPWLPPDLARQVQRHERDFARGAAAAAGWPAHHHVPGAPGGVEATLALQCQRVATAIRARAPFAEVVAGMGAVAHLCLDLNQSFPGPDAATAYARSFASLMRAAGPRIPLVFYGQDQWLLRGSGEALQGALTRRRQARPSLGSIVREDMDRVGGPGRWPALDDRSSSFGAASLVLNHSASDFANLASWVWRAAGGHVPDIPMEGNILVWRGEARPREARPVIRIRKSRG